MKLTPEQESEYRNLLRDPFLSRKYDRRGKWYRQTEHIRIHHPGLIKGGKRVLDIGCGTGEFLEACVVYGNEVHGIDAPEGDNGMGPKWARFIWLLHRRKDIPCHYADLLDLISMGLPFPDSYFDVINSQGALSLCFLPYMRGRERFMESRDAMDLEWDVRGVEQIFLKFSQELYRILNNGGYFLCYDNTAVNQDEFNQMASDSYKLAGFASCSLKGPIARCEKSSSLSTKRDGLSISAPSRSSST